MNSRRRITRVSEGIHRHLSSRSLSSQPDHHDDAARPVDIETLKVAPDQRRAILTQDGQSGIAASSMPSSNQQVPTPVPVPISIMWPPGFNDAISRSSAPTLRPTPFHEAGLAGARHD
jgi:hypothetical protein